MSLRFVGLALLLLPLAASAAAKKPLGPVPVNVRVPALAGDDSSVVLVWDKPADYADVADYNVYMNGRKLGGANHNNDVFSPAKRYIDAFYAVDRDKFHVRIGIHNFTVTGLKPSTKYSFTVRSVFKDGHESGDSGKLVFKTTAVPKAFDITQYGAQPDGRINTKEIQAAIDACSPGGKVVVPRGVFKTGALFLKSDMTLEIAEGATLLGSDDAADYPMDRGYRLYPYSKYQRPPSLLNALDARNIRIVGKGTIDGNGWKKAATAFVTDEVGNELPQYVASKSSQVRSDGILAKAQFEAGLKEGLGEKDAYGQRRSSLVTMRGARNVYYAGVTILNPANHGLMNLDCEHVVLNGVVFKTYDANNADGMEFGNSDGGMVFNCFFDTGDDSVNFAAGTGEEASKQRAQQNVWIFDNYFREGHGAVVAGSHTGAWIQKILAEDNVINRTDAGLRCKSTPAIGGGGRDIVFRDTAMKAVAKQPFIFTLEYKDENANLEYPPAKESAVFRDITVRNVSVEKTRGKEPSIKVKGLPDQGIFHEKLTFENVTFRDVPPADIDGLKDSIFKNVVYKSVTGNAAPWKLGNNQGLTFEGSTENKK